MPVTAGKTFWELQRDVAEGVKLAAFDAASGNVAAPPTDAHRLDRVKRAINDGLRMLAAEHDWNCLKRPLVLTLAPAGDGPLNIRGDPSRYRLPEWSSGAPLGPWSITGGTIQTAYEVRTTSLDRVIALAAAMPAGGIPSVAAVVPHTPTDGGRTGFELRVAPAPDAAYTMTIPFLRNVVTLADDAEYHAFGAQHDMTVFAYAMRQATLKDLTDQHAFWVAQAERCLANSKRIDGHLTPRTLGPRRTKVVNDQSPAGRWNLNGYGVESMTIDGVPVYS